MSTKRLAIDPGDLHVGYAYDPGDGVVIAGEWTPTECVENVTQMMTEDMLEEVIIEEFVLYEWEAGKQSWSDFKTPQLIGMLKLLCRWFRIPWYMQSATIKKPTRRQMRARGIEYVPGSIHSRDAQEHLFYRTKRRASEECQSQQSE